MAPREDHRRDLIFVMAPLAKSAFAVKTVAMAASHGAEAGGVR
jgi:hypothetical protein